MTNQRKIYYRRKEGKIIVEGKMNKKTIFLFTLPEPSELLKSSFLTQEKKDKIMEKINRLDMKPTKVNKQQAEVRTTDSIGSSQKDDFDVDDEINELVGRTQ